MFATLILFAAINQGNKPPTLDPTYGMPLPKARQTANKLPLDADWIWTRETRDDQTVYFRKAFDLNSIPKDAELYITADNTFDLFVNGKELGHSDPDKGDDMNWTHVHRYRLDNLRIGRNAVAVIGWNASGAAGLLVRLQADGKPILFSNWEWMQQEAKPPPDWTAPDFSANGWTGALRIQSAGGDPWASHLEGWPVPLSEPAPYLYHTTMPAVSFSEVEGGGQTDGFEWVDSESSFVSIGPGFNVDTVSKDGQTLTQEAVVDFGQELTGRVRIDCDSPMTVQIGTGESASEAVVRPWTKATLDLEPDHPSYSIYTALRYVAISWQRTLPDVALNPSNTILVSVDHLYYPVEYKGSFDCSDPLLTKIWYTGAYTAHSCMQEDIWDAPKRDRMRWMGDLHVSGEVINNVFLDRFLMEQTMSRLRKEAQGDRPLTELPVNHVNGIPGYTCAWIAGLSDFYKHTGDLAYLKSQHDAVVTMLEYSKGEFDQNNLFQNKLGKWPFVDWSPGFDKDGPLTRATTQLFFALAAKEASYLLAQMGDQPNSHKYAEWAIQLQDAARDHLVENGTYGDRRQENAMAIYSGVATPEQTADIWQNVLIPSSHSWKQDATPYYNNYVIFAMSMAGHTQDALDFVRRYWGGMLDEGATTFWEGYDPSWPKDNFHAHLQADDGTGYFVSLCHGWSAGATNFLTERVLGVGSTGPGFSTCEIKPNLCDLKWASGTVPTPHGPLKVLASASQGLTLDVPRGVRAHVVWRGKDEWVDAGRHII